MGEGIRLRVLPAVLPLNIELGTSDTHIQWRYEGGEWQDLAPLPTFSIGTVTTLEPDEEASAENVGTGVDVILNLSIPQGVPGVVQSIQVGDGLTVDNTDPANPILEATGGPGSGAWQMIAASAVAVSHTGDTAETVLATIPIPAGAMGANGVLRLTVLGSSTDSSNIKTMRVRLGGVSGAIFGTSSLSTNDSMQGLAIIRNRNDQAIQVGYVTGMTSPFGTSNAALTTSSADTSSAVDLVITGALADSGDAITLEAYMLELYHGA